MANSGFAIIGIGYCHADQVSVSTLWSRILHTGGDTRPVLSSSSKSPASALVADTVRDAALRGRGGEYPRGIGLFVSGDKPSNTRELLEQQLPGVSVACEAGSEDIVHLGAAMAVLRSKTVDVAIVVEYALPARSGAV